MCKYIMINSKAMVFATITNRIDINCLFLQANEFAMAY
jgi:hypothetical protein